MSKYEKIKVRKGKWADSPQNSDRNTKRQDRRERRAPKAVRRVINMEGHLRRMMAEEVGESELAREHRFTLLQKFGLAVPRIDRKVTKPIWMEARQWNQMSNDWHRATKGLVPQTQPPTKSRGPFRPIQNAANSTLTKPRNQHRRPNR